MFRFIFYNGIIFCNSYQIRLLGLCSAA